MIDERVNLVGNVNSKAEIKGIVNKQTQYIDPLTQEKTAEPLTISQEIIPDENYTGLSKVTISAVDNNIDSNITSGNIKDGVSILGIEGNVVELQGETREITANGTYSPNEGKNGITQAVVNVAPDTSDATAIASEIAEGKTAYISGGKITGTGEMLGNYINLNPANNTTAIKCITSFPYIDTSDYTSTQQMFENFASLPIIPALDTSKVTTMSYMCNGCSSLITFPALDTSKVTTMSYMCNGCSSLITFPALDTSKATSIGSIINYCTSLTNLGGFQNLGQAYSTTRGANYNNYKLDLSSAPLLTHDSLMNVINNLYDIATKGCNTQSLKIGATNLAKLTAQEIAIATEKGWTVS